MARLISLATAERIIESCKAEALSIGQPMNIAVVDDGANLVAFSSMDDTKLIGVDISQKKALTAVYSAGTVDEDHRVAEAGRKAFLSA